jgi:PST family polysaccharide transporter
MIARFYAEPRLVVITLALSVMFLLSGLVGQHLAVLNRQMRFQALATIRIGSVATGIVVGIILAALKCGYWSLVGLQLSTPVVAVVLTWRASRWWPQWPIWQTGTGPLLRFGANVSASAFIYSLARAADGVLIGRVYGPHSLGLYSRASALLVRPVDQLTVPLAAVLIPALSRLQAQPERYRRTFLQIHDAVALIGLLLSGLLLALARPITLVLLGQQWRESAGVVAALAMTAVFLPLFSASSWLFASQGRGRDWLLTGVCVSVVTVCAFIIGLPFGPMGVGAVYSAAGLLIGLPVVYQIAGRSGPVSTSDLWTGFLRQLPVLGVVLTVTWLTLGSLPDTTPLLQLLVGGFLGLGAGAGFVWIFPPTRKTIGHLWDALQSLSPTARRTTRV